MSLGSWAGWRWSSGWSLDAVSEKALPIGEAFKKLVEFAGESPATLTQQLYQTHHVGLTWYCFAAIGVLSALMIFWYGRWILKLARKETATK